MAGALGTVWVAVPYRSVSDLSESFDYFHSAAGFDSAKEAREVVLVAAVPFPDQWWLLPAKAGKAVNIFRTALRL